MDFHANTSNLTVRPCDYLMEPGLKVSFSLEFNRYYYGTVPLACRGALVLGSKVLSTLREAVGPQSRVYDRGYTLRKSNERKDPDYHQVSFEVPLCRKALLTIEEYREKHQGDVKLMLNIIVQYLKSDNKLLDIAGTEHRDWKLVTVKQDQRGMFIRCEEVVNVSIKISASDWVKDFLPAFGVGTFISYDIPVIDAQKVTQAFKKRIKEAIASIADMEKARRQCEWNQVLKESRPVLELVKKDKIALEKLLKDGGFHNEAIEDFINMLQNFHDYSSKFIHKMARGKSGKLLPTIPAQREDAELAYAMAINIVNVISQKIYRDTK